MARPTIYNEERRTTSITIDTKLLKECKSRGIIISEVLDSALRNKLSHLNEKSIKKKIVSKTIKGIPTSYIKKLCSMINGNSPEIYKLDRKQNIHIVDMEFFRREIKDKFNMDLSIDEINEMIDSHWSG